MAGPLKNNNGFKFNIKHYMRVVKINLLKANYFYLIMSIIILVSAIIMFFPILLRIDFVKSFASFYLDPLKELEYKTAFLALVGGLLGTFISIFGALTIQSKFSKMEKEHEKAQKRLQGITFFHRIIAKEFFANVNKIFDVIHGYKHYSLSMNEIKEIKTDLVTTKFDSYFEKLFDLNPELTLLLSEIYQFIEKIIVIDDSKTISKEEIDNFLFNYNRFQAEFNH